MLIKYNFEHGGVAGTLYMRDADAYSAKACIEDRHEQLPVIGHDSNNNIEAFGSACTYCGELRITFLSNFISKIPDINTYDIYTCDNESIGIYICIRKKDYEVNK